MYREIQARTLSRSIASSSVLDTAQQVEPLELTGETFLPYELD